MPWRTRGSAPRTPDAPLADSPGPRPPELSASEEEVGVSHPDVHDQRGEQGLSGCPDQLVGAGDEVAAMGCQRLGKPVEHRYRQFQQRVGLDDILESVELGGHLAPIHAHRSWAMAQ
jgi:hypothetical protein